MDIRSFLFKIGIESPEFINLIYTLYQILILVLIGSAVYIICRHILSKIILKIVKRTPTKWDDMMLDNRFFARLSLFITPLFLLAFFDPEWFMYATMLKTLKIWLTFSIVLLISSTLDGANRIYESYPISKNRPITVFIQVIMVIIYCMAIITVVGFLLDKDPKALLVGLGAATAVLLIVFKDPLLNFVGGVQLISNRMVNIGDWIVMPSNNADGDVLEINLTSVKVQNWDKTITTIPTYKLVSESFTNWRGMFESNGRRIKRSINIDIYSVHYLTEQEIQQLKNSSLLKDYIEQKVADLEEYNANRPSDLDARRLTNIGTFREYVESYISLHPDINQDMVHMVRQLQPGPTGIPLEIYCFSAKQKWVDYERVQADIFDHLLAVISLFNLKVFQYPGNMEWMQH